MKIIVSCSSRCMLACHSGCYDGWIFFVPIQFLRGSWWRGLWGWRCQRPWSSPVLLGPVWAAGRTSQTSSWWRCRRWSWQHRLPADLSNNRGLNSQTKSLGPLSQSRGPPGASARPQHPQAVFSASASCCQCSLHRWRSDICCLLHSWSQTRPLQLERFPLLDSLAATPLLLGVLPRHSPSPTLPVHPRGGPRATHSLWDFPYQALPSGTKAGHSG